MHTMANMTNLPVDLVLVRHGQSEGNLYGDMAEGGMRDRLHSKHTSDFRLTDLGRLQAGRAGAILQQMVGSFDKMYCSEYVRAVETAAHMVLPESSFQTDFLIREQDNGTQKGQANPLEEYTKATRPLARWWVRKGGLGESFADMCVRLRLFLDQLRDTAAGLRVVVVCHANVIRGFRALLEDMKATEYDDVVDWKVPNCHIRWYTRREGKRHIHIRPYKVTAIDMEEAESMNRKDSAAVVTDAIIHRPLLTAAELRVRAEAVPQLLNNKDADQEEGERRHKCQKTSQ